MGSKAKYPEHDKLQEISDQSQVCGEFLEWIKGGHEGSPGLHLCEWREESDLPQWVHEATGKPVPFAHLRATQNLDWYPAGFYSPGLNTRELLAPFFDIDQKKIDDEKDQMLREIREANSK